MLRIGLFIGDLLLLNLAVLFSYKLLGIEILGPERTNTVYLFIFSNVSWLFLVLVSTPYNVSYNWGVRKILKSQLSFVLIHLMVVASLIVLLRKNYSPLQIALMYLLFVPAFFLAKMLTFYGSAFLSTRTATFKRYIIIGKRDLASEIRRYFTIHPELHYRYSGTFVPGIHTIPLDRIQEFCKKQDVSEVYCCLPDMLDSNARALNEFCMDSMITLKLISDHRSLRQRALALEQYDEVPVFDVTTLRLEDWRNQWIKRAFDLAFAGLIAMSVLIWMIPLIGLLIRLESPGPIFFTQLRSGKRNRPFYCLKFRTMVVNREADSKQATANDPRITRLGAFLRKTSLDEFPQFLNVLWGDMSIVGPRPHPIKLNEKFHPLINKYMIRHYVKPGVTGLAQVKGYRGETKLLREMRNRIRLDRFYISTWSFGFDVKIIFMTIISVLTGDDKAY